MKPKVIFRGKYLNFLELDGWEFVERAGVGGVVAVVAMTEAGRLVLIEQHRVPVGQWVIELPAGLAADTETFKNETLAEAARRELWEETGYEAESIDFLTEGPLNPGISTHQLTVFRARGLRKTGPGGGDETENILVHEIALTEVPAWLELRRTQGIAVDPKVYAALFLLTCEKPGASANLGGAL